MVVAGNRPRFIPETPFRWTNVGQYLQQNVRRLQSEVVANSKSYSSDFVHLGRRPLTLVL